MAQPTDFREWMGRVRNGDQEAATELVRQYEPEIRRFIRLRLTDPHLYRVFDSLDICQSVLANFFVRVAAGQFDLEEPSQLVKLLVTMARNKLFDQARKPSIRNSAGADSTLVDNLASGEASPSEILSHSELLQEARLRLTEDEHTLAKLRADGLSWDAIALKLGNTPEALRKKLGRAVDRVCKDLGIDRVGYA
jgi:RNA polymerase sigma-70 factor (ECF subfamily)